MMLSSLRSYLSAQFFSENTESQNSDELDTTSQNLVKEVGNDHIPDRDDKLVGGLKGNVLLLLIVLIEMVALAKESSTKLADGLKNTAKQISEKVCSNNVQALSFTRLPRPPPSLNSTELNQTLFWRRIRKDGKLTRPYHHQIFFLFRQTIKVVMRRI